MKYTIISVDETRKDNKNWIDQVIGLEKTFTDFVDARIPDQLKEAKSKWKNIATPGPFKAGEFGIFYSTLNCLEYGANDDGILYFEDDATPISDFQPRFDFYINELPRNFDMFAVWSPDNQANDYKLVSGFNNVGEPIYNGNKNNIFDFGHESLCHLWQGYGNVSMCFSRSGCQKLLKYIEKNGFFSPIDCLICIAVHGGYLQGYALKPEVPKLINYDWNVPTTIHHSKWGMIGDLI